MLGGGGAVGLAAIQLSVAAGCSVSTTCGSKSIDRVLEAGAEQAVDYTAEVAKTLTVLVIAASLVSYQIRWTSNILKQFLLGIQKLVWPCISTWEWDHW